MKRIGGSSIRRLAMSSALVGAAFVLAGPAAAQDHGLLWDGPGLLQYVNPAGSTLEGNLHGVFGRDGSVSLINEATVRGLFSSAIVFQQAGSSLSNSGLVEGAQFGLTTGSWFNPATGQFEGLAISTVVGNTGTIRGLNNDGVRLIGGGSVSNSGIIEGLNGPGTDGISIFRHNDQDVSGITSIGTVDNFAGGSIFGNRIGVILSVGGVVNNAGSISGNVGGVTIQDGLNEGGKTGTLANSGSISGGDAVAFYGALVSASLTNSGSISGTASDGIANYSDGPLTIDNQAGGSITGALKGIHAAEGAVIVTNAGTVRGNGTYDGFNATPDGGISIGVGGSSITNSGSITGARFGITTYNYFNAETGLVEPRAVGTVVNNLAGGSIMGDTDDGVRLIGGGTVTNAGTIEGRSGQFSDGVSMFALQGQDTSGLTGMGTITNEAGGTIIGNRFGISSGGGIVIHNAGTIIGADFSTGTLSGFGGGVLMQAALTEVGKIGTITNTGTISAGSGVLFGSSLASGTLTNSGSIMGTQVAGVENIGSNAMAIDNLAGGTIGGQRMGVWASIGAVAVNNAGTITGNGFGSNGAIVIEQGNSSVTNTGLIQGNNFGITANPFFNSATGLNEARATNTLIENSGTIRGLNNDGVRLQGGGTITNSGLIEGVAGVGTDGVSMFSINGQDLSGVTSIGTVNNLATGSIRGNRFGIILSTGGTVNNAGSIWAPDFNVQASGGIASAIVLQDGLNDGGKIGTVTNSGSINGGHGVNASFGLISSSIANSGSITGRVGEGVRNTGSGALAVDNQAGGSITGATWGILGRDGAIAVTNAGAITAMGQAAIQIEQAGSSVSNGGLIEGANYGITTASFVNAAGVNEGRAIGTIVENSGTIRGQNNDGVRLIGGGTVTNSGLIEGLTSGGADGVSVLTHAGQNTAGFSSMGTVNNQAGGAIFGNRFGIIMSTGGLVNNMGGISGNSGGVSIQDGLNDGGKTGTVANGGSISGGSGVTFGVHLVATALTNSGSITGTQGAGVFTEAGALTLTNSGTIRSDGTSISANIPDSSSSTNTSRADGGVVIAAANSVIDNSGSISGRVHGIVVVPQINIQTGAYEGLARNTSITNSGLIRGETDDGIRLAGGGSVVNSGTIEGLSGTNTDGITMFAFAGQDTSAMPTIGSVTNLAGGSISGARVGILMSKGGTVANAGSITGGGASTGSSLGGGVVFQNSTSQSPQFATLTNSGTITGTDGVRFNGGLNAPASITNSGTISGTGTNDSDAAILHYATSALVVTNTATGIITGPSFGIAATSGPLEVNNAGQIISPGGTGFSAISVTSSGLRVSNTGLVQGYSGIEAFSPATGHEVSNSGIIRGLSGSGVLLSGNADVTNSGLIEGPSYGVSLGSGNVTNLAGGLIDGNFYAVNLSGGGTINNAGMIDGNITSSGSTTLINSGTISGRTLLYQGFVNITNTGAMGDLLSYGQTNVTNTGTIAGSLTFGALATVVTLGAGSIVQGSMSAGLNFDRLRLDSGNAPAQTLGSHYGFEQLDLVSGQWLAPGYTGNFDAIAINGGKLTLTGQISGNVSISNSGSFQIGTGGSIGGFAGNITNNSSLIVDIGSDFTLTGALSGTGSVLKAGAGRLTLAGIGTHSGPALVSGGTLAVTGQIASQAVFQAGTTLSGTGTVGNVTLRGGATLSPGAGGGPGDGIGTLNVIGQLRFDSGSRYVVNANEAGQADRVNVTGSVVIAPNVIVNVLAQEGNWTTATKYVILSATQRIVLPFAGVTSDLVFLEPKLSQNSKVVELTLKRKGVKLSSGAVTINQANVADALETMNDTNQLMSAVLGQNATGAQMAFETLSGSFFGSLSNQLVASAGRLQSLLQPAGELAETGIASWSEFTPATRSASSADYRSGFSLAGNGVRLSMVAGWLPQERLARGSTGMASMETHYSGTMLSYADGGFRVSAGAGFSWHRIIADRSVAFPGFADGNQARYRGATRQLFAEAAQSANIGPVVLTPFAGYSDIRLAGMDIREAGGGTGLIIDGQARRLGLAQLGLRTSAALPLAAGMRLSARLNLAWQRAWGDLASVQNSRFATTGAGFVYQGQQLAGSGLDIDAGLTLERGNVAFTAGYRRNNLLQRFDDGAELGMRLQF